MLESLPAFCLVALATVVTPGPTVMLALHNGSRFGVRAALAGMLGAVSSDFILIAAVAAGLGALLASSAFWFGVVKWFGVAYLVYLGLRLLRAPRLAVRPQATSVPARTTGRTLYLHSLLAAIGNPKGYLFFSALLPQFIVYDAPSLPQYLTLALLFAAIDFLVMLAYAAAGSRALRMMQRHGTVLLDRCCGGVLLALAGMVALLRRPA